MDQIDELHNSAVSIINQIKTRHEEIVNTTNNELESINTRISDINKKLVVIIDGIKQTGDNIGKNDRSIQNNGDNGDNGDDSDNGEIEIIVDSADTDTYLSGGKRKKSKGNTKKVKQNTTKNKNKHKRLNGNKKKQTQKRRSRKGKKVNRKK